MSDQLQSIDEQSATPLAEEVPKCIGKSLQAAREALNMPLEQVARELRLDVRLLKALEADDFASLPGTAYAYGYLRSYAKLLKISDEELLKQFMAQSQTDSNALIPEHMTFASKNKLPSFSFGQTLFIIMLLILVIGAIAWVLLGNVLGNSATNISSNVPVESVEQVVSSPVEDASLSMVEMETEKTLSIEEKQQAAIPDSAEVKHVEIAAVPQPTKALQLSYQKDSWTEVRDASGATLIYRMVNEGESLELEGKPPYTILLGYAPGVSIIYNNAVFDTTPYRRDDIAYFRIGKNRPAQATEE